MYSCGGGSDGGDDDDNDGGSGGGDGRGGDVAEGESGDGIDLMLGKLESKHI